MIEIYKLFRAKVMVLAGLLMLLAFPAFAQRAATVKGTVKDQSDVPIIGATVIIDGTTRGTITDENGIFEIDAAQGAVLVVSYMGYVTQEATVTTRTIYDFVLASDSQEMDEVVVVGYGVQRKETLTGSISSVGTETLVNAPVTDISNALQGKLTGVSTIGYSGQPGEDSSTVYVRGVGSLTTSASSPLVLVDGVEGSYSQLDPNEIDTFTVLKDASATAVFGVRGANGVILITTRRGKSGETRISYNGSFGIDMPTRVLEWADSYTLATKHNEMNANDGVDESSWGFSAYDLERFRLGDDPIMYPDIDWQDELMNDLSVKTQHNVNLSGGNDVVRYFVSAGYLYQNGLFENVDPNSSGGAFSYQRYNYRSNFDINITKSTTLKIGLSGNMGDTHEPIVDMWDYFKWSVPMMCAGFTDTGELIVMDNTRYEGLMMDNHIMPQTYNKGSSDTVNNKATYDMTLSQKLDFITKGLSFDVKGTYNGTYTHGRYMSGGTWDQVTPHYQSHLETLLNGVIDPEDNSFDPDSFNGAYNTNVVYSVKNTYSSQSFSEGYSRSRNWYAEAALRYNRSFGQNDHNVSGLLLYNQSKKYYIGGDYNAIPRAYVGLVGRATYDYKTKYMLELNAGYNGSENFAPDQRFGLFPSASVGWIVTEEKFMKNQNIFQYLKIRASVGLVGNDYMDSSNRFLYMAGGYSVDNSGTDSTWSHNAYGYNFGVSSTLVSNGATELSVANEDITWEKSLKQNYGIDFTVLDNKLRVSADYFREYRWDILIDREVIPIYASLTTDLMPAANLGIVTNRGYEIELKWSDAVNKDFRYEIGFNMSYARNKIIEQDEIPTEYDWMSSTGNPVGTVIGYSFERFYDYSDFELDSSGDLIYVDGSPQLTDGHAVPLSPVYPGDAVYTDLNGDDVIDYRDMSAVGKPQRPEYTFGLNMDFSYKNAFLSMGWSGVTGCNFAYSSTFSKPFDGGNRSLYQFQADECWTPETASTATMPRISSTSQTHNTYTSDLWLRDGSYLRLKNLAVGYRIQNPKVLNAVGAKGIELKVTGFNLLTFDYVDIMDPEGRASDSDTYPITKSYTLNIGITF